MGESEPATQPLPLDVHLEAVDRQLATAGARARLAGRTTTQPTRFFAQQLISRLRAELQRRSREA